MKLRFSFQRKPKNDVLTEDPVVREEPEVEVAEELSETDEDDGIAPTRALAVKMEQLEAKLVESEKARIEQREELRRYVDEINRVNRESSAGSVKGAQSDYFSYSEVKEMTPEQVRKNFSRIVDSRGKWN